MSKITADGLIHKNKIRLLNKERERLTSLSPVYSGDLVMTYRWNRSEKGLPKLKSNASMSTIRRWRKKAAESGYSEKLDTEAIVVEIQEIGCTVSFLKYGGGLSRPVFRFYTDVHKLKPR